MEEKLNNEVPKCRIAGQIMIGCPAFLFCQSWHKNICGSTYNKNKRRKRG
nr:MAG TPA: hypothetical protein [Caudoviricetes sp.]